MMRIIQINTPFHIDTEMHGEISTKKISRKLNLLDADIVFFQPEISSSNAESSEIAAITSMYAKESFKEIFDHNVKEIQDYLKSDKCIVVFLSNLMNSYWMDESGFTTEMVEKTTERQKIIPSFSKLIAEKREGVNIEFLDDKFTKIKNTLNADKIKFSYKYFLSNDEIDLPIAKVKNKNKIVAGFKFFDRGQILYLPHLKRTTKDNVYDSAEYVQDLAMHVSKLALSEHKTYRNQYSFIEPEWLKNVEVAGLNDELNELEVINSEINAKLAKKHDLESGIAFKKNIRSILSSTGNHLENSVANVLRNFGYNVIEPSGNRVDIIISYNDKVVVCEVKGVTKSASERNVAQLEKWNSIYVEENGIVPKSLLVVCAYKDLPLEERKEKAFPDQMLTYLKSKSQSCMTTTTLFELHNLFEANKVSRDDIWNLIYNTEGIISI